MNDAMWILAQLVAARCGQEAGVKVLPVVERTRTVPSSMLLRQAGKNAVSVADHAASMGISPIFEQQFRELVPNVLCQNSAGIYRRARVRVFCVS